MKNVIITTETGMMKSNDKLTIQCLNIMYYTQLYEGFEKIIINFNKGLK